MKIVTTIARCLLGLLFLVYGLNSIFRFVHAEPFATAYARDFAAALLATPYEHILFALQVVCGLLLLANFFVPLALTILAGFMFNIYMFHIFLDPSASGSTIVATVLWLLVAYSYRSEFRSLLSKQSREQRERHGISSPHDK